MTLTHAFGEPYNWCDADCERCPLARECTVRIIEDERRRAHASRGVDPDEWAMSPGGGDTKDLSSDDASVRDVALGVAMHLDAPPPPMVVVMEAERLKEAGLALGDALHQLAPREPPNMELRKDAPELRVIARLIRATLLISSKSAQIATHLQRGEHRSTSTWIADVVPNLLLMEVLREDIRTGLDWLRIERARGIRRFEVAFAELNRRLDPLIESVDPVHRSALCALVESGAAPSPFCTLDEERELRSGSVN